MLTREQAMEAAFYSGANLLSFTDERRHNLDWMGQLRPENRHLAKREATGVVLALVAAQPQLDDGAVAAIAVAQLKADGLVGEPDEAAVYSWRVFVAVLRSCAALMAEERAAMATNVARAAGPPPAAASFAAAEDRIDWRGPDPLERIAGADRPTLASSTDAKPTRKAKR